MSKTAHLYMPKDHMESIYKSKNPLVSYVHNIRLNTIVNMIPKGSLKVLDAGCGEGHLIEKMHNKNRKHSYYGIDVTKEAVKSARDRCYFAEIKLMDLADIKYKDNSFDIITCTEVIEHIYEYRQVMEEFERALKKNGLLILTFPNESAWTFARFLLGRRPLKVPDHINSFTPKKLRNLTTLKLVTQINLPFNLPFSLSLGSLLIFRK